MGMDSLWRNIELPLVEVLRGWRLPGSRSILIGHELSDAMGQQIASLESEIYSLAGQEFTSIRQSSLRPFSLDLGCLLSRRRRRCSTDQEVLETLAPMHRICRAILDYRVWSS